MLSDKLIFKNLTEICRVSQSTYHNKIQNKSAATFRPFSLHGQSVCIGWQHLLYSAME